MENIIRFALSNFTLTFIVLGIMASLVSLMCCAKPVTKQQVIETFFSYFLLFGMGFSAFYNFVMHVFFGEIAAQFIGWQDNPFQKEVGFAAVIGLACFLLGAAVVHIYEMVVAGNFASGNAGIIFWTDILIPVIGFIFLSITKNYKSS